MPAPAEPMLFSRAWIRNSPWLAIALLLHVLVVAVASVMYVAAGRDRGEMAAQPIVITPPQAPGPPTFDDPLPVIPNRDAVPMLARPDEQDGPVNPRSDYRPFELAGLRGEPSDSFDLTKEPGPENLDPKAVRDVLSGAPGGTAIGVGQAGHYGRGVSPYVSRQAGDNGVGGDGPGQRGHNGPGGRTQKTVESVDDALRWLAKHQSPDGRWDCDGFSNQCRTNQCSGPGYSDNDTGVSGLALLCFLGAGQTHVEGQYKETVKNGLKYLMPVQDSQGCFGERIGQHYLYNHACAALAMAEAYGMTQAKALHDPAQNGIAFVLQAQNPYGAWRYNYPPNGDNDTSVTGWMVMALKSAKMSGLTIDDGALMSALTWVDQMTDPISGRTGYTSMGGL